MQWHARGNTKIYPHALNLELTLTGLHALNPLVVHLAVAGTPAVLEPGTTRSATACYPGSLEHAALGAHDRLDAGHTDWRGGWCPGDEVSFVYGNCAEWRQAI